MKWDKRDENTPRADRLRQLLVGKSITGATIDMSTSGAEPTGTLTLSDGTVLKVWGNEGCGGCDAGCYHIAALNAPEGVITNVDVDEAPDYDSRCPQCENWNDDCKHRGWYRVYVVAADKRTLVASFEGSDGNGYYGTGWWLRVEVDQ